MDSGAADVGRGPADSGSTDAWVDAGPMDAETADAGPTMDAETADAGSIMDAETADAGPIMDAETADAGPIMDAETADAGPMDAETADAESMDTETADAESMDAETADAESMDAETADGASSDAGPSDGGHYSCRQFSEDPGWIVQPGLRAVTVAGSEQGLSQPVALAFAEGDFGSLLYIVDRGNSTLFSLDVVTGTVTPVVEGADWARTPELLTTIVWDRYNTIDGRLYVGDQGEDGDGDSVIFGVLPTGENTVFAEGPGPGLDDVYALAFPPPGTLYADGLYVAGQTDGMGADWGLVDATGQVQAFSDIAGVQGMVFDDSGQYGNFLIATRPDGRGFSGDGSITVILPDGTAGPIAASGLGGVHAVTIGPGGTFGRDLYAASWSDDAVGRIKPGPVVEVVALGAELSGNDGNILAFSPDGEVLFVADLKASRVVCIEAAL
ncbi:MAG: hypothetical protein IPK13_06970 [Deltaproteobacteria bacterium]|nr:hypothetical protein [Deltaproteobacteria bacterium]